MAAGARPALGALSGSCCSSFRSFREVRSKMEPQLLQAMIEEMKKATKVQRDIKVGDIFELSYVKKANEELKASGWKP